jgi:hypothetical protein
MKKQRVRKLHLSRETILRLSTGLRAGEKPSVPDSVQVCFTREACPGPDVP